MKKITSSKNPLIKEFVQLSAKQSFRNRKKMTILEGSHLAGEYLRVFGAPEFCLVLSGSKNPEVQEIVSKCESLNAKIIELEENIYTKISPVKQGIGVIFVVKNPTFSEEIDPRANSLILENIQDAGNLGAILRSAAAFGVEQIFCSPETVAAWSPKVLRAGMGAHFALKIFENQNLAEIIEKLKVPVFATSLEAEKSIFEEDLRGNSAWIFGNEGKGVSAELQNLATKKVIIPQNPQIESLNVAMAATVCLSERWRQNLEK